MLFQSRSKITQDFNKATLVMLQNIDKNSSTQPDLHYSAYFLKIVYVVYRYSEGGETGRSISEEYI